MHFSSFSAFFEMGGYAFYVWTSFAVTLLSIVLLFVEQKWRKNHIQQVAKKEKKRLERIKKAKDKARQS
ncbi:heme exporter protein CcmD [Alteromonas sp. a30]|uniref:heme exporter protein CcmD n=1 Tax=Alteromonas sp. a30 TaxID=2730917 RepID=UPI00227DAFFD|nr:heme exporter protein CcmD [Alteromonas sp. a30]MCY7294402.1 heme exporter protein CcmD [Alteromonas sp. a30]